MPCSRSIPWRDLGTIDSPRPNEEAQGCKGRRTQAPGTPGSETPPVLFLGGGRSSARLRPLDGERRTLQPAVNAIRKAVLPRNPHSATLTSSTDHSEVFSQNSLPWHTACAIIVGTRCWTGDSRTIATTGDNSCSTPQPSPHFLAEHVGVTRDSGGVLGLSEKNQDGLGDIRIAPEVSDQLQQAGKSRISRYYP